MGSVDVLAEAKEVAIRVDDDELLLTFVVVAYAVPFLFQIENEGAVGLE